MFYSKNYYVRISVPVNNPSMASKADPHLMQAGCIPQKIKESLQGVDKQAKASGGIDRRLIDYRDL